METIEDILEYTEDDINEDITNYLLSLSFTPFKKQSQIKPIHKSNILHYKSIQLLRYKPIYT